jgi:glycosyltransferase involved in cell wall biosynthesis
LYTAHGFHFFRGGNPFKNAFFFALERLAACWTDALIVINREDHDIAKRFRLAPPQRLFWVLGVGIDVEKYRPDGLSPEEKMALKAELGCEGKVVGMIGEFNPGKRHIDLLQAAERVWIKRPGVTFLLIGRGPLLSKLRRRMEASLYRDKVKFLGSVSDVSRLLNIMDVFVLPSVREGLPRSVQEAMAAEVPVVAADTRGNRDLVQHGKTGLLVPPLCPSRLAEAILHILGDKELARRLGKRGRQLAIEKLALERVVPQIVEIHERLLEGSHHVSNDVK